jgi:hypothetical protein
VELKAEPVDSPRRCQNVVPNVPCGVESTFGNLSSPFRGCSKNTNP